MRPSASRRRPRTIPTCVGTSVVRAGHGSPTADHPHVRGDIGLILCARSHPAGPSPRAWGHPGGPGIDAARRRTIPTCVGTSRRRPTRSRTHADHPHVRGDIDGPATAGNAVFGPSPRAWGHRGFIRPLGEGVRTIPTCVGTSIPQLLHSGGPADHPHVRGDIPSLIHSIARSGGPSPRAWGHLAGVANALANRRTIPTCVGTSRPAAPAARGDTDHPHVRGDIGR